MGIGVVVVVVVVVGISSTSVFPCRVLISRLYSTGCSSVLHLHHPGRWNRLLHLYECYARPRPGMGGASVGKRSRLHCGSHFPPVKGEVDGGGMLFATTNQPAPDVGAQGISGRARATPARRGKAPSSPPHVPCVLHLRLYHIHAAIKMRLNRDTAKQPIEASSMSTSKYTCSPDTAVTA